jgi:tRNA(Ile)-lysidine synthetase-like protein
VTLSSVEQLLHAQLEELALSRVPVLIGYSGGPDSTALLAAASAISSGRGRYVFKAVYIDHALRPRAEREEERILVEENCCRFGIPLHMERLKEGFIEALAEKERCGTEAAARKVRYTIFNRILDQENMELCLLAHTMDDQVETVLQRVFEGAGIDSVTAIPQSRERFYRPFLSLEKCRLIGYLKEKAIPFITDSSNDKPLYLRNRIRNELLPVVSSIFPAYRQGIVHFVEKQKMADEALDELLPQLEFRMETSDTVSCDYAAFFSAPFEARRRYIYLLFNQISAEGTRLPYALVKRLCSMDKSGERVIEAFGTRLQVEEKRIFWKGVVVLPGKNSYIRAVHSGDKVYIPGAGLFRFWYEKLMEPVMVRSRINGDEILLSCGRKKIKKLFQEWSVPEGVRDILPVLEDRNGLVAVFGSPFGFPDRTAVGYQNSDAIKMEYVGES